MNQRLAAYVVLAVTSSIVLLAITSFIYIRYNHIDTYYWSWVLLAPTMFWLWVVAAWCDAEMFKNSKPNL
ncbi:hypothetical protein KAFR_0I00670 [Kazachstania africana CBS 2517]|uniref:Uncharacterized protein n=1 Tax=Kazachstania africana (strain ATCC 22294 / BCRC 22015 / CBS 2517 / CECT 1963 / NBRC 1671 / NRRL Y-8276) TaxID=1071382 RepID=H2AZP8_KAZAF|nr:hypothetical protein KAFR_0I00670 [Kazachstania africana CBS 2517]CCF59848.1 hypothetical protein KAFR_0I00670 [Kazachstania africana CBS 2517]